MDALPWGTLQELTEVVDKLHNISKEIFDGKVTSFEKGDEFVTLQVGQGKDIMSVLRQSPFASFLLLRLNIVLPVKANRSASEEDKLPEEEVFGQMKWVICFFSCSIYSATDHCSNHSGFIVAALETTTSAISRVLHLLTQNQDVQNKIESGGHRGA